MATLPHSLCGASAIAPCASPSFITWLGSMVRFASRAWPTKWGVASEVLALGWPESGIERLQLQHPRSGPAAPLGQSPAQQVLGRGHAVGGRGAHVVYGGEVGLQDRAGRLDRRLVKGF